MPLSQIVSDSIQDGAVAPVDLSSVAQYTGFKNRIINGAMVIDQRNNGASVATSSGSQVYSVDRWCGFYSAINKYTIQQNAGAVTPPTGYKNYLGATSSAATSLGASDYYILSQRIEGYNIADLGWGTSSAATVTLSFWVRSSLTGTFGGSICPTSDARSYVFSYTISAANTWEQKSITIAGDTAGTWNTTNGVGISIYLGIGVGSSLSTTAGSWVTGAYYSVTGATSVVGTNGATFYITGVQLEKGVTATSFDYRPYGTELALCQRYYFQKAAGDTIYGIPAPYNLTAANSWFTYFLPIPMRAIPTVTSGTWATGAPSVTYPGYRSIAFNFAAGTYYMQDTTTLTASAEL